MTYWGCKIGLSKGSPQIYPPKTPFLPHTPKYPKMLFFRVFRKWAFFDPPKNRPFFDPYFDPPPEIPPKWGFRKKSVFLENTTFMENGVFCKSVVFGKMSFFRKMVFFPLFGKKVLLWNFVFFGKSRFFTKNPKIGNSVKPSFFTIYEKGWFSKNGCFLLK